MSLTSVTSCWLLVQASDGALSTTEKQINLPVFADFYVFQYFSIKIDKIDCLITDIDKIDNHKKLADRFPDIYS